MLVIVTEDCVQGREISRVFRRVSSDGEGRRVLVQSGAVEVRENVFRVERSPEEDRGSRELASLVIVTDEISPRRFISPSANMRSASSSSALRISSRFRLRSFLLRMDGSCIIRNACRIASSLSALPVLSPDKYLPVVASLKRTT